MNSNFLIGLLLATPAVLTGFDSELAMTSGRDGQPQQLTLTGLQRGTRLALIDGVIPIGVMTADSLGEAHFSTALLSAGEHAIQAVEWKTGRKVGTPLHFAKPIQPAISFQAATASATGTKPNGAVLGDLEGKGLSDLIFFDGSAGTVMRMHNVNGAFGSPAQITAITAPTALVVGDFNGDGQNDLAVAMADGRVAVLINKGTGEFFTPQYSPAGAAPSSIVSADFNGDGIPDLAIANRDSNDVSVLLGNGDGTFVPSAAISTGTSPRSMVIADFNGDGLADLATANFGSNDVSILLGDGKGTFRSVGAFTTGNGPVNLLSADFNGDGVSDLAVLNQIDGTAVVLLNKLSPGPGAIAFQTVSTIAAVTAIAAGDVNGDGVTDLLIQSGTALRVQLGGGDGAFAGAYQVATVAPSLLIWLEDLNHDGRVDAAALDTSGTFAVLSGSHVSVDASPKIAPGAPGKSNPTTVQTKRLQAFVSGTTASSVTFTSSPGTLRFGQTATFTATVTPAAATGSVTFYDGTAVLGIASLAGGHATLSVILPSVGARSFKAYYSGDTNYAPTSSRAVSQVTAAATPGFLPQVAYNTGGAGGIGGNPGGVAVADFNGDGKSDMVTANTLGSVSVFLGNGDGTFQAAINMALSGTPAFVATGDFNGDGKADFVIANYGGSISVYLGNGNATFQAPVNYSFNGDPYHVVVVDCNGDGKADLAVASQHVTQSADTVSVLLGNGDGSFQTPVNYNVGSLPAFIVAADFNGDGIADLATANAGSATTSVLLGNGDGTFRPAVSYAVGVAPTGLATADANGDGVPDLLVGNAKDSTVSFLAGKGDGTFQGQTLTPIPTNQAPVFISMSDLNQDGKSDLIVANSFGNNVSVLSGNGDGTFQAPVGFTTGTNPYGIALGDFNGDGLPDLSVVNIGNLDGSAGVSVLLGSAALRFVTAIPCRIADTRLPTGPFGGPSLSAQVSRNFNIPNSTCAIPAAAQAYSLNITVVPSANPLAFLTVWPAGQAQPVASTLNSYDGRTKSNAAIVPAGTAGAISLFAYDSTDVILDINGYFVAAYGSSVSVSTPLSFYPLTPCRMTDTRNPNGTFGGPYIPSQTTRSFPVATSTCGVPATAQAYSLNYTILPRLGKPFGYMTTWPTTQTKPIVSTLNAPTGAITANAALVPAGTDSGKSVSVFVTEDTDLIIDINGYFAPPTASGLSYYSVRPCRVLDSRTPAGNPALVGTLAVSFTGSSCAPPATSQAFVFSATVTPPAPLGYIAFWPQGQTQPVVSTLNDFDGTVVSNMAIVPAPTNPATGIINAFASDPTFLILDLLGYFAP